METAQLKKFAQYARRNLIESVSNKLEQVLADDSPARRESPKAITDLEKAIQATDKEQVIEKTAYIWFNRFCALRFMDVNRYNRIGVLSPVEGQIQPEILAEAKAGLIDETSVNAATREKVTNLLNGTATSRDPQTEAYRLLIVAVCNDYHRIMPYLFERIADYTELLMPDDLLSENSILEHTRQAMSAEACESVESIGWLYQFYISEKKDDIFAGLKKNIKVTPENIPAATQLFTPHWIVRYLVENSLGRLWMLNNPDSKVIEQMDYYIKPADENAEQDYLRIQSPEDLKICDPACGSGHMLTYAYDLLYAIYLDKGYDSTEIPEKILTNNLYGIEIDERAAELAAFALTMKAMKGNPLDDSNNRRRFFRSPIKPNICRLENISFTDEELDSYISFAGRDLFTQDLRAILKQFEEADNFGSLIQPELKNVDDVRETLKAKDVSSELFLAQTHQGVLKVLEQADYLSPKYHVVIANPPYMGGKGMNGRLGKWVKDNYPNSNADLFAVFIERNLDLVLQKGQIAMITMQSWMFLSSYEKLRSSVLNKQTIITMAHLGSRGFDSIGGEIVSTTAFVINKSIDRFYRGSYLRLTDGVNEAEKDQILKNSINTPYRVSCVEFEKVPGSPIAYWIEESDRNTFVNNDKLSSISTSAVGQNTGDNDKFLKFWHEVPFSRINFSCKNREDTFSDDYKWYPYNKGGGYRKWYGNFEYVINWQNDAEEIKAFAVKRNAGKHWSRYIQNLEWLFSEGLTWSDVTSGRLSARYLPESFISDVAGQSAFFNDVSPYIGLSILNSSFVFEISKVLNPTIHFQAGNYRDIPYSDKINNAAVQLDVKQLVEIAKADWDSFETSWNFKKSMLINDNSEESFSKMLHRYSNTCKQDALKTLELEMNNNTNFSQAYGISLEIFSDLTLRDVTLSSNTRFLYKGKKTENQLEDLFLLNAVSCFISYAVGCMFGRYSLDKEGLILANQGETLADYLKQIPQPQFEPDDDNVTPLIDLELERGKQDDWFEDDISERFKVFLKVTFGTKNYDENLRFIEEAIGKDIKKFFLKDFYTDHIKRYKKRPIYWLFSSPKGSFNALIYMHRYRSDTVSVVLNDYLREFGTKLTARKESYEQTAISVSASTSDKAKALKAVEKINKVQEEIKDYERDILYPLAGQNIEIDLDDGVKYNYPLFGKALKKVAGLSV